MDDSKQNRRVTLTFMLSERQHAVLDEAKKATGLSYSSLIRKCIDMNVEYLRKLAHGQKQENQNLVAGNGGKISALSQEPEPKP